MAKPKRPHRSMSPVRLSLWLEWYLSGQCSPGEQSDFRRQVGAALGRLGRLYPGPKPFSVFGTFRFRGHIAAHEYRTKEGTLLVGDCARI